MFVHLFTLVGEYLDDRVSVDAFYCKEIPDHMLDGTGNAFKIASQFQPDLYSDLGHAYKGMSLRTRFDTNQLSSNVLLLKTDFEMDRNDVEMYVNSFSKSELKQFLKEAKIA